MSSETLIIIVIAAILMVLAIKILKRIAKTIFSVIIVAAALSVIYLYTDTFEEMGLIKSDFAFSIDEFQNSYCANQNNFHDSIKCKVIVEPIVSDLKKRYTAAQLEKMEHDKKEILNALRISVQNQKPFIHEKLKELNALHLWNDFLSDMRKKQLFKPVDVTFDTNK